MHSGILLSIGGVTVVAISILSSFGFMGYIGSKLTPLNTSIVPFLGLGLGVDEIFIIMRALTRKSRASTGVLDVEETVSFAWKIAGPSILVTTMSNFGEGVVRVCVCVSVCVVVF